MQSLVYEYPNNGSVVFNKDRFNNTASSILWTNRYAILPSGVYIAGDFSIALWIAVTLFTFDARMFEVGNPATFDNVAFGYTSNQTGRPFVLLYNGNQSTRVVSPIPISPNKWIHLATTLNGTTLRIYTNGNVTIESDVTGYVPRNVVRTKCFLGYSSLPLVAIARASLDQIKIFNRALSADEVFADFKGPAL